MKLWNYIIVGNDYNDNLIGFYTTKRSILMTNDLALYFTDFRDTNDIKAPIFRHRNLCDVFIINYKSVEFNPTPNGWKTCERFAGIS